MGFSQLVVHNGNQLKNCVSFSRSRTWRNKVKLHQDTGPLPPPVVLPHKLVSSPERRDKSFALQSAPRPVASRVNSRARSL